MAGLGVGGISGMPMRQDGVGDAKTMLNTCIHNYFISEGKHDLAMSLMNSGLAVHHDGIKKDPKNQVNGIDPSNDGDSKDDQKNRVSNGEMADNFLLDYWFMFWDMWNASKGKTQDGNANQYLHMTNGRQLRGPMLQQPLVNNFNGAFNRMPNQFNGNNLQKMAQSNNMNGQGVRRSLGQQQMQREGSGMDMNGDQHAVSPGSGGENAPSPKRARMEGGFNGAQMGMQGRGGSVGSQLPPGATGNMDAMAMQNQGLDPSMSNMLPHKQASQLQYQQAMARQAGAAMTGLGQNGAKFGFNPGPGSPSMAADGNYADMVSLNQSQMRGQTSSNGGALADYQMQLMLLEQQNKKRLMMARQEAEAPVGSMTQPGFPGGNSPNGRQGQSPNPGDAKHPSPKMGQGSPMPDGSMPNRNSPAPNGFDPSQMNGGLGPYNMQMNKLMGENGMANGQMLRAPSSHPLGQQQMEMLRRNGGQMPNGNWNGQPMPGQMMQQGQGGPPNPTEGNQPQRGNMPPPQGPPPSNKAQTSPSIQNAAPPTPSQKKDSKSKTNEKKPKKPTKKQSNNASQTSNAETEKQSTPPPQTPVTPIHPDSQVIKGQNNQQNGGQQQNQQQGQGQANGAQAQPGSMQPPSDSGPFGNFADSTSDIMNFGDMHDFGSNMAGGDGDMNNILEAFDFDSFINEVPGGNQWDDGNFNFTEGLETETGQ